MFLLLRNSSLCQCKKYAVVNFVKDLQGIPQRNSYTLLLANSNVFQTYFGGICIQYIAQYTLKKLETCFPQSRTGIN